MLHNEDYLTTDLQKQYDIALYDPPFEKWKDILNVTKAKYYICFTDSNNRHATEELMGKPDAEIVWHFNNGSYKSHNKLNHTHEYIFIYGDITKQSYCGRFNHKMKQQDKGKRVFSHQVKPKKHVYYCPRTQRQIESVINCPRHIKKGGDIWSKPEYLLVQILQWLGDPGDKIWDGFAGTGNVGLVSKKLGLEYEGYEIDRVKYKKANRLIKSAVCGVPEEEIIKIHIDRYEKNLLNYGNYISDLRHTINKLKKDLGNIK